MSAATLRNSLTNIRQKARMSEADARRTGAMYGGAVALGIMSRTTRNDAGEVQAPMLDKVSVFGMPGAVVVAIGAKAGAAFSSGDASDYLNGLGDAAAVMALAAFAAGREVAGTPEERQAAATPQAEGLRTRRLERQLRQRLAARRAAEELRDADRDEQTA